MQEKYCFKKEIAPYSFLNPQDFSCLNIIFLLYKFKPILMTNKLRMATGNVSN